MEKERRDGRRKEEERERGKRRDGERKRERTSSEVAIATRASAPDLCLEKFALNTI